MTKKNRFRPKSALNVNKSKSDSEESNDSDNDSDDFGDQIDYFHKNNDKNLLNKSSLSQQLSSEEDDNESDEEIMPFDDDSSDSDQQNDGLNRFAVELKKNEMASDLEDSDEEDLTDSNAWGTKKNVFYNTDYVDKDFKKYKQKDEDLAKYEEEEALQIQRRLLGSINESDVGLELLVGDIEPKTDPIADRLISNEERDEEEERLQTNLLNLTKRQKLEILRKESPELDSLISDFRSYLTEIKERLLPVMTFIKTKKDSNLMAIKYIETRYHIAINYCINICFYMTLKAKGMSVKDHPVIKEIVCYKKLLAELNAITSKNSSIDKNIDLILENLNSGKDITFNVKTKPNKKQKKKRDKTIENEKTVKRVKFDLEENRSTEAEDPETDKTEELEAQKRGITYEMAKNKGLTPKRKKELRNPRVKHRMKFRKAKIRRKGQVREPRKELQRYGGEISGIKSTVIKSVKFK